MFNTLIQYGHNIHDIKHNYSADQVWLFFNDIMKKEMEDRRADAITIANSVAAGTPADSRKGASQKEQNWKKFLDSLDPNRAEQHVKDKKNPLKALAKIAEIPMFNAPSGAKEGAKK